MISIFKNNPLFFRFWIATIASELASRMHSLILIWIIYKWTNSALFVGIAMVAASLPAVLISPYAGSLIDRHNKVGIMMMADFSRLIIVLIFSYLYYINVLDTTWLISGTVLISLASAFFNPASYAMLPTLVHKEEITQANAIGQISGSASSVVGPLFGSALIATLGVSKAFMGAGVLFLISVLFLYNIKDLSYVANKISSPILEDIKHGFKLVKQYAIVHKMMLKMAVVNFFFSALTIIVPIMAKSDVKEIAYLMSAIGAGMLSGSLFLSTVKLKLKPNITLSFSLIFIGIAFILTGFSSHIMLLILEMFVMGFMLNLFNITLIAIYQTRLPQASLGKIMSLIIAVSLSLQPISYGIVGAAIGYVGVFKALLISGLVILISAIGVYHIKELNQEEKLD